MKRWLVLVLALLLILSGCDNPEVPETTSPTNLTSQETTAPAPSVYLAGSRFEVQTDGAVLEFVVEDSVIAVGFMGNDPVVFSFTEEETTILTRLDTNGTVKAQTEIAGQVAPVHSNVGMKEDKLVYYSPENSTCCVLNGKFEPVDTVPMPEDLSGLLFTADLTTAYYSCGQEIRAMDLQTEIPRLVCQLNAEYIWMETLLFDDTVFCAYVTDTDENSYNGFYSTQTGQLLETDKDLVTVQSWDDNYMVRRMDGGVTEVLLGIQNGELSAFKAEKDFADICVLPRMEALLELGYSEAGAAAAVYRLGNGNRISRLALDGAMYIFTPVEDPTGRYIWFITNDPDLDQDVLCRWEVAASEGADTVGRIGKRATADAPDTEGLARCRQQADALEAEYDIEILLHHEVLEPWDYTFTAEYQVDAISLALEDLEKAMARFPEGFFQTAASVCDNGTIYINIVREMIAATDDAPEITEGLQYWIDGNAYIALSAMYAVEQNFYHELSHVLDTFVYSNSIHYDFWEDNNPKDFSYDECYTEYESHYDSPWLDGEERAFIDAYSMTYAKEDRARFLEYAMMEYNWEYFAPDTMQLKLRQLCMGIREAFGWEKNPEVFPWEQYLAESLAYTEE